MCSATIVPRSLVEQCSGEAPINKCFALKVDPLCEAPQVLYDGGWLHLQVFDQWHADEQHVR